MIGPCRTRVQRRPTEGTPRIVRPASPMAFAELSWYLPAESGSATSPCRARGGNLVRIARCGHVVVAASALLLAAAGPALGHHSFAVYDFTQQIPFQGVVATLSFRNPHI